MGFRPEEKGIKTPRQGDDPPPDSGWDSDLKKKGLRPSRKSHSERSADGIPT